MINKNGENKNLSSLGSDTNIYPREACTPLKDDYNIKGVNLFADYLKIVENRIILDDPNLAKYLDIFRTNIKISKTSDSEFKITDGWGGQMYIENRLLKEKRVLIISPGKNKRLHFAEDLKIPIEKYIKELNRCFLKNDMKMDVKKGKLKYLNNLVDDDIVLFAEPAPKYGNKNIVYGYMNEYAYIVTDNCE